MESIASYSEFSDSEEDSDRDTASPQSTRPSIAESPNYAVNCEDDEGILSPDESDDVPASIQLVTPEIPLEVSSGENVALSADLVDNSDRSLSIGSTENKNAETSVMDSAVDQSGHSNIDRSTSRHSSSDGGSQRARRPRRTRRAPHWMTSGDYITHQQQQLYYLWNYPYGYLYGNQPGPYPFYSYCTSW